MSLNYSKHLAWPSISTTLRYIGGYRQHIVEIHSADSFHLLIIIYVNVSKYVKHTKILL